MLTSAIKSRLVQIFSGIGMNTLQRGIKAGLTAGICGVSFCALDRKFKLSTRVAGLAHSVEAGPFPGTNLYAFLTACQMSTLYSAIADDILEADGFEKMLDINTGPGLLPIDIARKHSDAAIIGVDESPGMVQIAEANAVASKVDKSVEFVTGDPANLPFPGRYFDFAVSVNALHHWRDPLAVLHEIHHILTPGGEFWIYDYRRETPEWKWDSLLRKLPLYLRIPFLVGPMASWRVSVSEKKLLDMVAETHFEVVEVQQREFTMFGRTMPVFNRYILRKPLQNRETD